MKKIGKISISFLALVAVIIAFNFLAIHHHHHEMAVPIVVELLGSNGDDADSDASHTCHHPGVQKCSYHQAALRNNVVKIHIEKKCVEFDSFIAGESQLIKIDPQEDVEFYDVQLILKPVLDQIQCLRAPPVYSFLR